MTCHHCLAQFAPRKAGQRFCSAECRCAERNETKRAAPGHDHATLDEVAAAMGLAQGTALQRLTTRGLEADY